MQVITSINLSIKGKFMLEQVSKRTVLEVLRDELNDPTNFKAYLRYGEVQVRFDSADPNKTMLEGLEISPFESLPKDMQDCIAQRLFDTDAPSEVQLAKLKLLSRDECFEAWCEWNGLLNFVDTLRNAYQEIYAKVGVIR